MREADLFPDLREEALFISWCDADYEESLSVVVESMPLAGWLPLDGTLVPAGRDSTGALIPVASIPYRTIVMGTDGLDAARYALSAALDGAEEELRGMVPDPVSSARFEFIGPDAGRLAIELGVPQD